MFPHCSSLCSSLCRENSDQQKGHALRIFIRSFLGSWDGICFLVSLPCPSCPSHAFCAARYLEIAETVEAPFLSADGRRWRCRALEINWHGWCVQIFDVFSDAVSRFANLGVCWGGGWGSADTVVDIGSRKIWPTSWNKASRSEHWLRWMCCVRDVKVRRLIGGLSHYF